MTRIELFELGVATGKKLLDTKDPIDLSLVVGNAAKEGSIDGADFSTFTQHVMQTISTYRAMQNQKLPSEVKAAQAKAKAPDSPAAAATEPQQPTGN
jgi:hypothetical protein